MVAQDGLIYSFGGNDSAQAFSNAYVYNPSANTWTNSPPLLTARKDVGVGAVNGFLYAVGGDTSSAGRGAVATNEAFQP